MRSFVLGVMAARRAWGVSLKLSSFRVGGTRNGGQELTISTIANMMSARQVNIVSNEQRDYTGGRVWSRDMGAQGVAEDGIGLKSVRSLGAKVAEVCLTYHLGRLALAAERE